MSSELLLLGIQKDSVTYAWGTGQSGRLDNTENFYDFVKSPSLIGDKNFSSIKSNTRAFFGLSGTDLWVWGKWDSGNLANGGGSSPVQIPGSWTNFSVGQSYNSHVLAIKSGGTLWAWGDNFYGQLGTGDTISRSSPVQIGSNTWLAVAAGNYFSIALRSDNTVWTFGIDTNFELGQGLAFIGNNRSSPVQIAGGGTYTNVFAGPSTGYAIRTGGTLWGWGENNTSFVPSTKLYLLATGVPTSTNRQSAPVQISSSTSWQKVSCNGSSVLALKSGELFAWGTNTYGQLGTGNYTTYSSPVQVGAGSWIDVVVNVTSFGINSSNELYGWGNTFVTPGLGVNVYPGPTSPILINNSLSWSKVTGGSEYTYLGTNFACTTEPVTSNLYGWGQIVNPTEGIFSTTALLYNKPVELRSSPVQISSQKNLFTKFFTNNGLDQYDSFQMYSHAMALTKPGAVYGWGWNEWGQLGDGTLNPRSSPVLVSSVAHTSLALGDQWTLFLRSDGTLWACGYNLNGQLGTNNRANYVVPAQVGTSTNWTSIAAGSYASFAINSLNHLYCWGNNSSGEFGTGGSLYADRSSPVFVGTDYASVYAGPQTSYVIKTNGTLWSSGTNQNYVLGQGTPIYNYTTTIYQIAGTYTYPWVKVAPAVDHVLALNSAGDVYAWGTNAVGQFGTNTTGFVNPTPVFVTSGVSDIAVGAYVSFIVKSGVLYGFGSNLRGQLGLNGGNQYYSSPVQIGSFTGWTSIAPSADGDAILGIATPL